MELDELVPGLMAHYHVPGVAVGLWHDGRAITAGFGITNTEHPLPVDANTLFQIGSITKTVTGTVLMRLVELGRLDLDLPVRTYLPTLKLAEEGTAAAVTVRHLATHTGGWVGDFFDECGPGDDALARMLDKVARLPQIAPLGEVYSYNNAGFYIAGRVIEAITGQTYEQAARELVLDPLGMDRSFFFAEEAISHRVAVGHRAVYDPPGAPVTPGVDRPWGLARTGNPVGGLISTVTDQLKYARLHLGEGEGLLRPETLRAMHAPRVPAANGEQLGVTWFMRDVAGVRLLRHGGATKGQCATLELAPARGLALSVLTNSDRGSELHQAVARWAFERYLGIVESGPEPVATTETDLAQFAGHYTAALSDRDVYLQDGQLWLQSVPKGGFPTVGTPPDEVPPPTRMGLTGHDRALLLDEPFKGSRAEFLRGPAGEIVWLRVGGRIHRRE
jgi:CubicO group peptidase (beta-lactamase class C family)